MGKPYVHAEASAKRFGGKPGDYIAIHEFIDSSRKVFGDVRHRALTHNSWFVNEVLPRVFGDTIMVKDGESEKKVSVALIGEHHILEDFGGLFIPSPSDFLAEIEFKPWMDNAKDGATPGSHRKLHDYTHPKIEEPKKRRPRPDPFPSSYEGPGRCGPPGVLD